MFCMNKILNIIIIVFNVLSIYLIVLFREIMRTDVHRCMLIELCTVLYHSPVNHQHRQDVFV